MDTRLVNEKMEKMIKYGRKKRYYSHNTCPECQTAFSVVNKYENEIMLCPFCHREIFVKRVLDRGKIAEGPERLRPAPGLPRANLT